MTGNTELSGRFFRAGPERQIDEMEDGLHIESRATTGTGRRFTMIGKGDVRRQCHGTDSTNLSVLLSSNNIVAFAAQNAKPHAISDVKGSHRPRQGKIHRAPLCIAPRHPCFGQRHCLPLLHDTG